MTIPVPDKAYGILCQDSFNSDIDEAAEQIKRLGYSTLDSGYSTKQLNDISESFDRVHELYVSRFGLEALKKRNEHNTLRAMLAHGHSVFLQLATNHNLLSALRKLIDGKFILNQQNGVINPAGESYNQGAWHRDLPYQHFVCSTPLAVNALFCVDDFTVDNGATFILPASHKTSSYPSKRYIDVNATQVEAKAGQFILLDCMLFHSGGFNSTAKNRRAINHVYTIPYFKQQINLNGLVLGDNMTPEEREILGYNYQEPTSIEQYLGLQEK